VRYSSGKKVFDGRVTEAELRIATLLVRIENVV
jgi:hypothetical protein